MTGHYYAVCAVTSYVPTTDQITAVNPLSSSGAVAATKIRDIFLNRDFSALHRCTITVGSQWHQSAVTPAI